MVGGYGTRGSMDRYSSKKSRSDRRHLRTRGRALASLAHDKVPMAEILAGGGDPGGVLTNPKTTDMIARSSANIAYRMMRYSGNVRGERGR